MGGRASEMSGQGGFCSADERPPMQSGGGRQCREDLLISQALGALSPTLPEPGVRAWTPRLRRVVAFVYSDQQQEHLIPDAGPYGSPINRY